LRKPAAPAEEFVGVPSVLDIMTGVGGYKPTSFGSFRAVTAVCAIFVHVIH
jgi:hypothetical protein